MPDLSWIVIAVNRHGQGTVMDASPGFYQVDLLGVNGDDCDDSGIYMPRAPFDIPHAPGLYRLTDIKISPGGLSGPPDSQEWEGGEISGTWTRIGQWNRHPDDALEFHARVLCDMLGRDNSTDILEMRDVLRTALHESPEAAMVHARALVERLRHATLPPLLNRAWTAVEMSLPHD
jgi:hypothetical protein